MVRKVLALLAVFFFVCGVVSVHAQEGTTASPSSVTDGFDFNKAYQDYVFVTDQYNKAHADYLLARSQYFQAQTLASQTKARDATVLMLQSRDDVMKAYLVALRLRLGETDGIIETTKSGLFARLDADVLWWKNHRERIDSSGTLNDSVADSAEAAKHFPTTEALAYEVLSTIPVGKEFVLRTGLNNILSTTKSKINQIRSNGDHNTANAERWVLETEQKLTRSLDKENNAQTLIASLVKVDTQSQQKKKSDIYSNVLSSLTDSLQYLKEATSYMKEVIKSIKTKQ